MNSKKCPDLDFFFFVDAECVLDLTCNPLPLTASGSEKVR